jgi:hypothetical protein
VSSLDINGNWTANSFNGSGSGLTSLNPANLSAGTAGINISGNAATATTANSLGGSQLSAVNGQGLSVSTNLYLNSNPIYLRNDQNHGLAYNGGGITNFPSVAVQPDGPVLWGYTGGALGVLNGGALAALTWNNSSVNVSNSLNVTGNATVGGNLSANNTPGVNWDQTNTSITLPNGAPGMQIDACGNYKPAPGYFVIIASADIMANGNNCGIELEDTTSGSPVLLTVGNAAPNSGGYSSVTISYVLPITTAGGFENFALVAESGGSGSTVTYRNLTVMYFPRLNN